MNLERVDRRRLTYDQINNTIYQRPSTAELIAQIKKYVYTEKVEIDATGI